MLAENQQIYKAKCEQNMGKHKAERNKLNADRKRNKSQTHAKNKKSKEHHAVILAVVYIRLLSAKNKLSHNLMLGARKEPAVLTAALQTKTNRNPQQSGKQASAKGLMS